MMTVNTRKDREKALILNPLSEWAKPVTNTLSGTEALPFAFLKAAFSLMALSIVLTGVANANVIGNDTQNFNPTTSGLDFVTVQSSETLKPGVFNFGLFLNYATNTLPGFESNGQATKFSDSVLATDLNIGLGLLENWDIGMSLPQIISQDVSGESYRGQFSDKGNTEVRFNTKYRLWGEESYGVALVGSVNLNRLKDNPYVGKDPGPTYNIELAGDMTIKKVALGLNLGYRFRQPGERTAAEIEPLKDQLIASVAASYLLQSIDSKVIFELFGSQPAKGSSDYSDREQTTAEALLGLKHDVNMNVAMHIGAGAEIMHGLSSPDLRAYAGINWTIGPTFSKAKTVVNAPKEAAKSDKDPFAGPPQAEEKIVIHDILFEFDSDNVVLGAADDTLRRLAEYVTHGPRYTKIVIDGHTDSIGQGKYNDELSYRRAATIRRWLVTRYKLDPAKVFSDGAGERDPIADNGNYQGRQLNRRVEFRIYRDMKK